MKKSTKLVIALAAMTMAASMCLFTACNGDNSGSTITTTVTEEQWKSALQTASENFTVTYKSSDETITLTEQWDGTSRLYREQSGETLGSVYALTKSGENYYYYSYNPSTATWSKSDCTESNYVSGTEEVALVVTCFSNYYSAFTYSETTGNYTCSSLTISLEYDGHTETLNFTDLTFCFENGALVSMTFENTEATNFKSWVVSDFGTTTVTLPTVS